MTDWGIGLIYLQGDPQTQNDWTDPAGGWELWETFINT
jgi:hypothetical protein